MSAPAGRLALWPNVGGEEPGGPEHPAARAAARLWRLLFPERAEWPGDESADWPAEWSAERGRAAFAWLPDDGLCAWWNDATAAERARERAQPLFGADPAIAARVHDKAFAARVADAQRLLPRSLRGRVVAFAPDELGDAGAFRERLRRELADWPDPWARSATLKPRLGTSGRGRVRVGDPEASEWEGALPRLAARGGAILEPWLEREADYSVQLHVARDGRLTLLGTLEQKTTASGTCTGHRGEIDHRGRVTCGAPVDDRLIEAALELARAAHAEGFHGPCGVDGFAFRDGDRRELRAAVELNARFTMGTVTLGLLHRAHAALDAALPPDPGRRRSFDLSFAAGDAAATPAGAALCVEVGAARLAFRAGPQPD